MTRDFDVETKDSVKNAEGFNKIFTLLFYTQRNTDKKKDNRFTKSLSTYKNVLTLR